MELNYSEQSWPLRTSDCPCDVHFVEYLAETNAKGKSIFHFGTGGHHLVGKDNHERGNPNEILGITASKDEHEAYVDFIVRNPVASNYYKVLFADIYTLSPKLLPTFDLVTLFHLAEFYDDYQLWGNGPMPASRKLNSEYARLNDMALVTMFGEMLNPGGKLLFYKRSDAFLDKPYPAATLVNELMSQGRLVIEGEYESLMICGWRR